MLSLGWMASQEKLKPAVEKELACLKDLGVGNLLGRGIGGSDHASFATAGIPACIFRQNGADYGFAHHSNADTISLAREPELIQGAEVMSIMALRLANMEEMLPRTEPTQRKQKKAGS